MKIGTVLFTLILSLIGFGFLASTTWNQSQEIQALREENKVLNQRLFGSQQALDSAQHSLDNAHLQLNDRDERILSLEIELDVRDSQIRDLQAENDKLKGGLIELRNQYQAEFSDRQDLFGQLNQCKEKFDSNQANKKDTRSNVIKTNFSDPIKLSSLWLTDLTNLLQIEPEHMLFLSWMVLILFVEDLAALYLFGVNGRREL